VRTEPLLEGKCVVWRNRSRVDQFSGELVFDYDLCRYKLFGDGEIAYSFNPLQVKDIDYDESGKVKKRTSMGLYVNYPTVTSTFSTLPMTTRSSSRRSTIS
jgi:hypothetical protein